MSSSTSSYRTFESEDDATSWLISSEFSIDDEDELTLLNGDEDTDEDSTTFDAFIKLSMRLKKEYNLREASVSLERCDKIWDTMQLLKNVQPRCDNLNNDSNDENTDDDDETDEAERVKKSTMGWLSQNSSRDPVPYIKYQPMQGNGNNALPNFYLSVKSQKKIYNCTTCGKIYNEKRAFRIHTKRDHGIAVSSPPHVRKHTNNTGSSLTRSNTPENTESHASNTEKVSKWVKNPTGRFLKPKNVDNPPYPCPMCTNKYLWKSSLSKHARDVHEINISDYSRKRSKKSGQEGKIDASSLCESNSDKEKKNSKKSSTTYLYRYTRRRGMGQKKYYTYTCIPCGKKFRKKYLLRIHSKSEHDIIIPMVGCDSGLFLGDEICTRRRKSVNPETKIREKASENDKFNGIKTKNGNRAGPKSSKNITRPKRACAINTSYREYTKDEEAAALQREILSAEANKKSTSSQLTKCFLCRSSYVDIIRHFKDYHRISHPDSVLPLKEKIVKPEIVCKKEEDEKTITKDTDSEAECLDEAGSSSEKSSTKSNVKLSKINEIIEGLYRKMTDKSTGRGIVQCLMCKYKYASYGGVRRHLANNIVKGVVVEHKPWDRDGPRPRKFKKHLNKNESLTDSSITDISTRLYDDDNSGKRETSSSDENSSTIEELPLKKQKIETSDITATPGKTYGTTRENDRRESVIRRIEKNFSYKSGDNEGEEADEEREDDDEDKTMNQRDTRDSSDRDSGIGISITIKKRNNSYEVVEKDNCCEEDKVKYDYENVKDENVISSDSSSNVIGSGYRNKDELEPLRRRESFNKSDYGMEEKTIDKTVEMYEEDDDDDVAIIEPADIVTRDKMSNNCGRKVESCHSQKASTIMTGNVPSLKILSRNVLTHDELSRLVKND